MPFFVIKSIDSFRSNSMMDVVSFVNKQSLVFRLNRQFISTHISRWFGANDNDIILVRRKNLLQKHIR